MNAFANRDLITVLFRSLTVGGSAATAAKPTASAAAAG